MASSHSGEDLHVRTLQAMYRRAGVSQTLIATGSEGMPLDALTAARLARDGEKASPVRHMCSGQHSVFLLLVAAEGLGSGGVLARRPPGPGRLPVGRRPDVRDDAREAPDLDRRLRRRDVRLPAARDRPRLRAPRGPDGRVRERPALVARARADPRPRRDARQPRDGRRDARPARHVADEGGRGPRRQQGRDGGAPRAGPAAGRRSASPAGASGIALKVEDGDGYERGTWAATVEVLAQAGVLDGQALRVLARYHRPVDLDPHGRVGAESIADFELAPLGERI